MHKLVVLIGLLLVGRLQAQPAPETRIFLIPMTYMNGQVELGEPVNTTPDRGYNNQPWFLPSNEGFLFSAAAPGGKTDIFLHHFAQSTNYKILGTSGTAEYSPRTIPGITRFAVVEVAADDTTQQLVGYDFPGENRAVLWQGQSKVGYFHFVSPDLLAAFVLGDSFTLHLYQPSTAIDTVVAAHIGRCLSTHPTTGELSFVDKGESDSIWTIKGLHTNTLAQRAIATTLPFVEDYVWLQDGSLLMGSGGKLYHLRPGQDKEWKPVADLSKSVGEFYRLAVSPDQKRLAVVSFTGARP